MTDEQRFLLRKVATAIVETVKESPMGAPSGHLYAALMSAGFSLESYEQIMAGLVAAKMVRKSGELYHYVSR